MIEDIFNKEKILIGQGREANVYLWNGFAYKCFNSTYPKKFIDYEYKIQNAIYNTGLPTIKYYESELAHSIKMDFIDGVHIGEKFLDRSYKDGVYINPDSNSADSQKYKYNYEKILDIMLSLFSQIHSISETDIRNSNKNLIDEKNNINLKNEFSMLNLNRSLIEKIGKVDIEDSKKQLAIKFISEIKDEKTLCHMDYHFFNIMISKDKYYVIDWMEAKLGNPIYDYARSYLILFQFVSEFDKIFLDAIKTKFNDLDLKKAIYVAALHRLAENDSLKLRELIDSYF